MQPTVKIGGNMKCFYHSADLDGQCSGAIVKLHHPNCELIGINYGDEFPWDRIEKDETVYMVDFSLQPFTDMERLWRSCRLVWFDHHKSAIQDFLVHVKIQNINGILKDGIGACCLVWQGLTENPERPVPTFIKLLAEYDVWNHTDPRTLSFQYGMRFQKDTSPENQTFWNSLFDIEEVQRITEIGGTILEYEMQQNNKFISSFCFETIFSGLRCICANKGFTNSQLFDSVWDAEKYDAMLTFSWRKRKWTVSLYSNKPGIDVSIIAKENGGGGHKGAAGFQTDDIGIILKGI